MKKLLMTFLDDFLISKDLTGVGEKGFLSFSIPINLPTCILQYETESEIYTMIYNIVL